MKIGYKVWLENNGKAFGDGPYELLRQVEKKMSLHQAAHQMGMSYSKAWRLIRTIEEEAGHCSPRAQSRRSIWRRLSGHPQREGSYESL